MAHKPIALSIVRNHFLALQTTFSTIHRRNILYFHNLNFPKSLIRPFFGIFFMNEKLSGSGARRRDPVERLVGIKIQIHSLKYRTDE
jgi:hypothetical protein